MSDIPGLVEALEPIARIFQAMRVNFYVGGSVGRRFVAGSFTRLIAKVIGFFRWHRKSVRSMILEHLLYE